MFRHIVMWEMKGATDDERLRNARTVVELMSPLPGLIPQIRAMRLDVNGIRPDENSDLVLTMDFDDRAGFEDYRVHPEHTAVGKGISPLYRVRLAVDFEVSSTVPYGTAG